jgi:hypothetical protein
MNERKNKKSFVEELVRTRFITLSFTKLNKTAYILVRMQSNKNKTNRKNLSFILND